jgi:hypothetical protein
LAAHVRPGILLAEPVQADHARLAPRVTDGKGALIKSVKEEYPCELLFLHRDADSAGRDKRLDEIHSWIKEAGVTASGVVPVIPVRMTEKWLLVDERAIRRAASNPNGSAALISRRWIRWNGWPTRKIRSTRL